MYCPKCGSKNPEDGSFCRSCGADLSSVGAMLSGESYDYTALKKKEESDISYESAFGKLFMGIAFLVISIILSNTNMGRGWWFWMLIPAAAMLATGVAHILRLHNQGAFDRPKDTASSYEANKALGQSKKADALPEAKTEFVPASRAKYETGDLVPPSVTDNTTRHLEMDKEGETMTLPKRED